MQEFKEQVTRFMDQSITQNKELSNTLTNMASSITELTCNVANLLEYKHKVDKLQEDTHGLELRVVSLETCGNYVAKDLSCAVQNIENSKKLPSKILWYLLFTVLGGILSVVGQIIFKTIFGDVLS